MPKLIFKIKVTLKIFKIYLINSISYHNSLQRAVMRKAPGPSVPQDK